MTELSLTPEDIARQIRLLVEQLYGKGRKDLLLHAVGVPLLEELQMEAAKGRLSRLVITRDYRFILEDYHKEVDLQPVHKAVYLLFLAHPEGIEFKRLTDYREELLSYYMATAKQMDKQKVMESVDHLTDPLDNAINEKCSRVRAAFVAEVDPSLADQYYIVGKSGEAKKITLPRDLVIWEK